ncbi:MAG TPA: ABC transporter substrate-binding protein [Actinophytocola sp.]|uniref:peptide ABC transporter substrate-binding protein n=1 Tax=Actinophytocola sp. TaxID=1872138 RepID=UPI002DDD5420|nr:ABC transporter substrate-binding protein [Actinophytocola sp.]HEV2781932.1 ABC transporter substrate-binding protein [Actinophytocola sp.]
MSTKPAVWVRAAACVTALGLVLTGCSKQSNTSPTPPPQEQAGFPETPDIQVVDGKQGGTFRFSLGEPDSIDPTFAHESEGITVTRALFTGLVEVEPDGKDKPAVAESWQPNDDCSEWTFNLKKGTKFHNGEEVTSASFKRGWERAVRKDAASDVAAFLEPIQGYDEAAADLNTPLSGVDATDPYVLKVKLKEPICAFHLRTYHPVFSPVPTVAGNFDNKTYNDAPIGNGPFQMDGVWQHDTGIRLKRFDGYTVDKPAYLDAVEITIRTRLEEELDGFKNGTYDWARIAPPVVAQARSEMEPQNKWISKATNGMNYLLPIVVNKPLDNPKARKAISLAIDRAAIVKGVFQNSLKPATSLVPAVFKEAYQEGVCKDCKFDVTQAKQLAQEAGLTPGTELNFQYNSDGAHAEWTAAVKQQLEQNLGLKVNYTAVLFADMLNNEQEPTASGIYRAAWGADYPDPENFLGPLVSTVAIGKTADGKRTGNNRGGYSNPKVDELLTKANATKDEAERTNLYKQVEQIAIGEDLALIPLWIRQQFRAVATDKFVNLRMTFGEDPDLRIISIK